MNIPINGDALPNGGYEPGSTGPRSAPRPGLFEALWRFRWLVVAFAVVFGGAAYGLSHLQPTTYQAEAGMILVDPRTSGIFDDGSAAVRDLSRYVRNQAEFAESTAVAVAASELLAASNLSVQEINRSVQVTASLDLDLVTIQATQPTAVGAADLANAIAEAYQGLVRDQVQANGDAAIDELRESKQELSGRIATLEASLALDPENLALQAERDAAISQLVTLDTRIEQINVNMALYGSGVQYLERAEVPRSRATPKPLRNAAAATVVGLLLAGAIAWWRTERLPLANERHDAAPVLGAPLLGEIPEFSTVGSEGPVPAISDPSSAAAEAYQFVVSSLAFALDQIEASTVTVTSSGPGAGKTVTALNLSVAAVGDGTQILLVDADERARGLSRIGGNQEALGFTDLARSDEADLADYVFRWRVDDDTALNVLPAGTPVDGAPQFFRSVEFRKVMASLRHAAPLVIFDSPPILAASEAVEIAANVDAVLLVVERGTPLRMLEETKQRIAMTGKPLVGYVFNRAIPWQGKYGYGTGYGYGYGYGYGAETERRR